VGVCVYPVYVVWCLLQSCSFAFVESWVMGKRGTSAPRAIWQVPLPLPPATAICYATVRAAAAAAQPQRPLAPWSSLRPTHTAPRCGCSDKIQPLGWVRSACVCLQEHWAMAGQGAKGDAGASSGTCSRATAPGGTHKDNAWFVTPCLISALLLCCVIMCTYACR
jgi:hypothetical protein